MQITPNDPNRVPRRIFLRTTLAGLVGAVIAPQTAFPASNESYDMRPIEMITALKSIGKPVCLKAADILASSAGKSRFFNLHLRSADLNVTDAKILADGIKRNTAAGGGSLSSFSTSYNPELGDEGAAHLAAAFPDSMTELGMVGCNISDEGGQSILNWAKTAPNLRMICVEGNDFSNGMKALIRNISPSGRQIFVVV